MLPTVFILGWFTTVHLIDTGVQNIVSRRRIESVRQYYAIDLRHARLFEPDAVAFGVLGVRCSARSVFFTMAGMILLVDSVVAGATLALVVGWGGVPTPGAIAVGVVTAVATLGLGLLHDSRRLVALIGREPAPGGTEELA